MDKYSKKSKIKQTKNNLLRTAQMEEELLRRTDKLKQLNLENNTLKKNLDIARRKISQLNKSSEASDDGRFFSSHLNDSNKSNMARDTGSPAPKVNTGIKSITKLRVFNSKDPHQH